MASMDFWGEQVQPRESLECDPGKKKLIHISVVAFNPRENKGSHYIPVYAEVNTKKQLIGILTSDRPYICYDLIFQSKVVLSHDSEVSSLYFSGYKTDIPDYVVDSSSEDEGDERDNSKMGGDKVLVPDDEDEEDDSSNLPAKKRKLEPIVGHVKTPPMTNVSCALCDRNFRSEKALEDHFKAKHGGAK